MFIQALAEYADNYLSDQLSDEAWEEKPVPYFVAFDSAGTFLNVIPNNVQAVRGKKTVSVAGTLLVPRSPVPRVAGLHPLLGVDFIKYVLGAGPWTAKDKEINSQERYDAFVALIREAASETGDEGLVAAAAFYSRPDQVGAARIAIGNATDQSMVALALVNSPLVRRNAVKACWRRHYEAIARGRVARGGDAECIISGKIGPIAPIHPKIKGLANLRGRAEVALMSFDKDSFCSYGWEQNANSPVCAERAMAYVLALNDLLRPGGRHRRDITKKLGFIFWTKFPTEFDAMLAVNQPTPEVVQQLLRRVKVDLDPNVFYMAGVAGNGGRMIIRYWVTESLPAVKGNLRNWFEELQVADVFTGELAEPPKLWQLLYAIEREGEPPADRVVALIRRAIAGEPLGDRMLGAALARLRVEKGKQRLDPVRAGLVRICLNDRIKLRGRGGPFMTASLDLGQKHEAYLCGRLMAVYESLQRTASKVELNQTVADRYFSLASTFPVMAFQRMDDLSKSHLRKLRREKPGAMKRINDEIDQLCEEIGKACGFKYPKALDLDGRGRFVLGYHHQRAQQTAQAKAAAAAKALRDTNSENQDSL